jgi:hypothetical protein
MNVILIRSTGESEPFESGEGPDPVPQAADALVRTAVKQ